MSGTDSSAPAPRRGRLYKYVFLIACAAIAWHVLEVQERPSGQPAAPAQYPVPAVHQTASGAPVALDARIFDQTIATGVHVVDFWADWCGPCRTQGPIIDRLARNQAGRIGVGKVDVDREADLANRYGVRSIPTIIVFKDGEVAARFVGVMDEKTLAEAAGALR